MDKEYDLDTLAVRAGIQRSQFNEHAEALYLTSSFVFDNAPPVSISIETRPEVGEGFAPIASLFKQFELIYVVGQERDIV